MPTLIRTLATLAYLLAAGAVAQDRSACNGIYCAQGAAASDYAAELTPLMVDPTKTWEQVKGRTALVIKYYDRSGSFVSAKTWPQMNYMKAAAVPGRIAFAGIGTPAVVLYGLAPCARRGSFDYKGERFTCETLWQDRLGAQLYATQVVLCRAYIDQAGKAVQDATCIRQTSGFGPDRSVGGVVIEDQLAGSGIVSLALDAHSHPLRPELAEEADRGAALLKTMAQ